MWLLGAQTTEKLLRVQAIHAVHTKQNMMWMGYCIRVEGTITRYRSTATTHPYSGMPSDHKETNRTIIFSKVVIAATLRETYIMDN
jgi:hypothetical protein